MSTAGKIAKNTLYQIIGKVLGTLVGLITVGLMTRYLGQTGYGYFTTVIAYLQFFSVLVDFGLQMATTQMISKPEADQQKIFRNVFTLRFFSTLIFLGLAVAIVWFLPYPPMIKTGVAIASLSFFFIALQSVLISIFQKELAMSRVALAEVWGRVALLIGVWLAIGLNQGLLYLIGAVVLGSLINFLILFIGSRRYFSIKFDFDISFWKKIWHTTWPLAITIALSLVYFRADTLIMSFFRPQNEVGIYGATYKVLEILIQFPYLFLGLILPLLTKFFVINKNLFQVILQKAFDFLVIIVVPIILATLILGEKIMVFVAGQEFFLSGQVLKILIFAAGIIYLSALFGYAVVSCELQKKMIKFYILDAVVSIPLYLIFIPIYSYWAAAIITVLTELIMMLSAFYVLKKYTGISLCLKIILKSTGAGLIMAIALSLLINLNIIVLIILGLLIYLWALYMLRGVSKQMLMEIVSYKN
ncbi:MAG: flippase [Patescibacteria group bacterium]